MGDIFNGVLQEPFFRMGIGTGNDREHTPMWVGINLITIGLCHNARHARRERRFDGIDWARTQIPNDSAVRWVAPGVDIAVQWASMRRVKDGRVFALDDPVHIKNKTSHRKDSFLRRDE